MLTGVHSLSFVNGNFVTEWTNFTCDPGWEVFRDQCFYFGNKQDTWDGASQTCANQNGHLAVVNDSYVQSFLRCKLILISSCK